ncbi:60S ribosomal protein L27 [Tupaia chinensis]|uniref:60S ribosomal protein L27 n=1 Tax=Tupaia chinensis TaxID=246437 RepID=L9L8V8_TUPCH|nr:60S ribosomal protein L27 [Tupaia chinensis]
MKNIDGTSDGPYSHESMAGTDHYPAKRQLPWARRKSPRVKDEVFCAVTSCPQGTPCIPLDKTVVNKDVFRDPALTRKARWEARVKFKERYKTGKNKWVFQKLRF